MIPTQVTPNRQNYVEIGKIYENLVTEVVFSVPDLGDGTGSYTVVFQRPKEAAPYPVAARVEFPNVIWEVGAADTAKSGTGKAEVRWYGDDGEVGKSKTFIVRVNAGLADPTEAPEAWEGYVGRVARNAETAETAAADAAASAQSAGADAVKAEAALKALEDGIASGDFRGEDGAVPNIQIGTVTTLPAGSNATASMGGTAENPLLNLGIPKGGGEASGEPDYEYVTTIEIAEDEVVSYELDLGAEYKEVLITSVTNITYSNNFTEYPGSSQNLLTSSGRIELSFFNGETALLSNRESLAHSIVIVLTVDASNRRSYAFTIRDRGIFLQASVMQQLYSGGLNTTTQYSAIARKSLISNNARMNKIVLGTSSANIYFTKGARLYVYGVKA